MKSEVGSQKAEAGQLKATRSIRRRRPPSDFKLQTCLVIASILICTSAFAQTQDAVRPSFSEWLAGVRTDALARGIRPEIVDEALGGVEEPLPVVLERDRSQAETVLSLETYLGRALAPKTIRAGREIVSRHRALLKEVSDRYGVPPRIIAGIWGMESSFGRFTGTRPIVAALATLAWDPRRSTFFRGELLDALEIVNRGDIELARLRGSWAGAMGQVQFMPSSYLKFAEDWDGDGRRDVWSDEADIFASIANYLKGNGWRADETWGREVAVGREAARRIAGGVARRSGGCRARRDMTVALPRARWDELGVRLPGGKALPASTPTASLVSGTTRHFLVYQNYDALLEYNCANSYAISVALLGNAVMSDAPVKQAVAKTKRARK
jgi:membrane-bound lytic murein transglycosylase B